MAAKEGEAIDILARLREAICIFTDLTKKETSNGEQRSKVLFDTVKQLKQEQDATSQVVHESYMLWSTRLRRRLLSTALNLPPSMFYFSSVAWFYLSLFPFGATSPNGESTKIGRKQT